MSSFILLAACLLLGVTVARIGNPPPTLGRGLNWWVLNVALSALVLQLVPAVRIDLDFWFLIASMWFVLLGAWAFFAALGRALSWSRERVGALTIVCGLGNTAFIGFPLIEALRGSEGLKLAVVADQAGCFLAFAVGGTTIAALHSGSSTDAASIARKVVFFPSFICLILGLLVGQIGGWPSVVEPVLARIASTLVPLALFSMGLQFQVRFADGQLGATAAGVAWKLLLAPLLVYLVGSTLAVDRSILTISVLEAAMGPMISAAILADQHDLEPSLSGPLLTFGIVLSFVTVPLANRLL